MMDNVWSTAHMVRHVVSTWNACLPTNHCKYDKFFWNNLFQYLFCHLSNTLYQFKCWICRDAEFYKENAQEPSRSIVFSTPSKTSSNITYMSDHHRTHKTSNSSQPSGVNLALLLRVNERSKQRYHYIRTTLAQEQEIHPESVIYSWYPHSLESRLTQSDSVSAELLSSTARTGVSVYWLGYVENWLGYADLSGP